MFSKASSNACTLRGNSVAVFRDCRGTVVALHTGDDLTSRNRGSCFTLQKDQGRTYPPKVAVPVLVFQVHRSWQLTRPGGWPLVAKTEKHAGHRLAERTTFGKGLSGASLSRFYRSRRTARLGREFFRIVRNRDLTAIRVFHAW